VYERGTFVSLSYSRIALTAPKVVDDFAPEICTPRHMARARLCCVIAALALAGCGNDLGYDTPGGGAGAGPDAATATGTTGTSASLPCDVKAILADHCQVCHGSTLAGGAPIHLVTYADLTGTNRNGVVYAQRALDRMRNTMAQMPPPPSSAVTANEIAAFQAWVAAGTPAGDCATGGGGGGGGGGGPFDGPPVCTSGTTWTGGNSESPLMHPGVACIACHARSGDAASTPAPRKGGAPIFRVAGTVYPTGHEPNDCNGATGATVEVTDATGAVTSLAINAAGNFFSSAALPAPIHVAVVANGKRRAMSGSPPVGDCNSCHTQTGANMAPGRIVLP
jgi:hypothetical protein